MYIYTYLLNNRFTIKWLCTFLNILCNMLVYALIFQVFGLLNDIMYAIGAYLIYVDWQSGGVAAAPPAAPAGV